MKKTIIFGTLAVLLIVVLVWFGKKNQALSVNYDSQKPSKETIVDKTVATGNVTPLEEVDIKPQISGIIDKIYVEEGALVEKGTLLATIRVVPNEQALAAAKGTVNNMQLSLNNAKILYDRNKKLYNKGVISQQDFENTELSYNQAKQNLSNAKNDYAIIKEGSVGGGSTANTHILATASGMILEIPVKEGYQVIQSNNFNDGTTIATIADMNKMIFEGRVDESEVAKLKVGTDLDVKIGAIENSVFPAKLNFIAPKGTEENGAVQFKIKADITLDSTNFVRAGYSANAEIILEQKDSVLAIKEALLQFDKKTEKPFVEVKTGDNQFERRDIEIGLSDGLNVEVISGVNESDEIKVWNKVSGS